MPRDQLGRFPPDASDTVKRLRRAHLREWRLILGKLPRQVDGVHGSAAKPPKTHHREARKKFGLLFPATEL